MSNQSLDLWSLPIGLAISLNSSSDDQLGGIGVPVSTVELTELIGSLGTKSLLGVDISQSGDGGLSHDNDGELEHFDVLSNDGSSDGLLLFKSISSGFETFMTTFHQHSNSFVLKYTLDHGKTLEVLATSNLKYVSLVLLAEKFSIDFLAHSSIIKVGPINGGK